MFRGSKAFLLLAGTLASGAAWAAEPAYPEDGADLGLRSGYVHFGFAFTKQADEGTLTMGGVPVPGADYTTEAGSTPALEVGLFLRDGFALSVSGIVPMTTPNIAAGTLAGLGNLGNETAGFYSATAHYHFAHDQVFSPYVGGGVGYMHVFDTTDGIISNLQVASAVGGVIQAGVDIRVTDTLSAYVDVKRFFLSTTATGTFGGLPIVASTVVDPWVVSAGASLDF